MSRFKCGAENLNRFMMKILSVILLFFIFLTSRVSAQNNAGIIHRGNITTEGILLNNGWKYRIGDSLEWAKPDFNDVKWLPINPTLDVHNALPQISRSGIGWFRLKFFVDSSFISNKLALVIQQSGASEIYLNGIKIAAYGTISSNAEKVKADDPKWKPLSISLNQSAEQVIAIRYAIQPNIYYTKIFETENPAFIMKIMDSGKALDYFHNNASKIFGFSFLLTGISLMIIILHLSFFILYSRQRANLFFALFAVSYVAANTLQFLYWLYPGGVSNKFYLGNATFALFIFGYIFLLLAAYLFLGRKKDFFYYFLLVFSGCAIVLNAWPYGLGWQIGGPLFQLLVQLNIARIAILSTIKKQRGAWIIAVGGVSTLLFFGFFLSQGTFTNSSFILSLPPLRIFTYVMQNISLPTASSIFLAFEFAFANRTLQKKLEEVNELSQQNISYEIEKQQILARQNETLEAQVKERTAALNQSLDFLKATQSQLIQSEKMASLGELTAGIAHEIQNPLNFVNNFSEVSSELMDEMNEELDNGDIVEAKAIAADIKQNLEKINHHGKRADAIVKGMLQHSRKTAGQKEATEINALADEYLRLSYHGFRAKDKSCNVTLVTNFDKQLPKINVVAQDIGRVFLNLFNNAFYAVYQKQKGLKANYQPEVTVTTYGKNGYVVIEVKDNGIGMPNAIKDKIMQPFFTTKPTGEGTGLGLSLTYDIVVKGHSGNIEVDTREGEGSVFIVTLMV